MSHRDRAKCRLFEFKWRARYKKADKRRFSAPKRSISIKSIHPTKPGETNQYAPTDATQALVAKSTFNIANEYSELLNLPVSKANNES